MKKEFKLACALCVLRAAFGFGGQTVLNETETLEPAPQPMTDRLAVDDVFDFTQESEGFEIAPLRSRQGRG